MKSTCLLSLFALATAFSSLAAIEEPEPPKILAYLNQRPLNESSRKYIITGGPGVGKTTLIRHFASQGYPIAEEAATDLIREELAKGVEAPWSKKDFNEKIALLQESRQKQLASFDDAFFDRSPIDVISYDILYDFEPTPTTLQIVQDVLDQNYYNKKVFLIENLGSCLQTEIRAETLEQSKKIEALIEKNYRSLGFDIVRIPACSVEKRAERILEEILLDRPFSESGIAQSTFKTDKPLIELGFAKEPLIEEFLAKGGQLHCISEATDPFLLIEGDAVYPICSGGWCRSQTLHALFSETYQDRILLFPPHAARYGWDPYDGKIHRDRNEKLESDEDEFALCFLKPKILRAGFENDRMWKEEFRGANPNPDLASLSNYFNLHYYGLESSYKGQMGKRRIYIAFAANTHVAMHRLLQANSDLTNVHLVSINSEDLISYPPEHLKTHKKSQIAYRHFSDFLKPLFHLEEAPR